MISDFRSCVSPALARGIAALLVAPALADWSHLAGNPARTATAPSVNPNLATPLWTASPEPDEEFIAAASPLATGAQVFLTARVFRENVHVANRVVAFDALTGERDWTTDIVPDVLSSWASPVLTASAILAASDNQLYALDQFSGSSLWTTTLPAPVVNASPSITSDLFNGGAPANRALITTYTGFDTGGLLLALNIDATSPGNPWQPGEIVWDADMPATSGATPAYHSGIVIAGGYVPTCLPPCDPPITIYPGELRAFNAVSGTPIWTLPLGGVDGFFGGVSIAGDALYAATYGFSGGANNSRLVKADVATGALRWSVPCERTSSIPFADGHGRVYLSAGFNGFGSSPKLQCFADLGSSASLIWDTDVAGLRLGGWTHHPLLAGDKLLAGDPGAINAGLMEPYAALHVINPLGSPSQPGFITMTSTAAGSTPAWACDRLFSIGVGGLTAFAAPRSCPADLNQSGAVDDSDLGLLLNSFGCQGTPCDCTGDINGDGATNDSDLGLLLNVFATNCE